MNADPRIQAAVDIGYYLPAAVGVIAAADEADAAAGVVRVDTRDPATRIRIVAALARRRGPLSLTVSAILAALTKAP